MPKRYSTMYVCAVPVENIFDDPSVSDVVLRIRNDLDVCGECVWVSGLVGRLGILTFPRIGH